MKNGLRGLFQLGFGSLFGMDTLLVLVFLGIEYGRAVTALSFDGFLMGTTMLMVLVLPYFLPSRSEKPMLLGWLAGRASVLTVAVVMGSALGFVPRSELPLSPLTLLIVASMVSGYLQFYALFRLRVAK